MPGSLQFAKFRLGSVVTTRNSHCLRFTQAAYRPIQKVCTRSFGFSIFIHCHTYGMRKRRDRCSELLVYFDVELISSLFMQRVNFKLNKKLLNQSHSLTGLPKTCFAFFGVFTWLFITVWGHHICCGKSRLGHPKRKSTTHQENYETLIGRCRKCQEKIRFTMEVIVTPSIDMEPPNRFPCYFCRRKNITKSLKYIACRSTWRVESSREQTAFVTSSTICDSHLT